MNNYGLGGEYIGHVDYLPVKRFNEKIFKLS